jgi:hypothetical protein
VSLVYTARATGVGPSIPVFTAETNVDIAYADGVGPAPANANRHIDYHVPAD